MNKEELENLKQQYKLSEKEHKEILQQIIKNSFAGKQPENKPVLKFVIAQPGAGKSFLIKKAIKENSNLVVINSDNYRPLRQDWCEILKNYPFEYVTLTNYNAHKHGDQLLSKAIKAGYSAVREKAPLKDFTVPVLPKQYKLEFDILAVGDLNSLLSTRERYEAELLAGVKTAKLSNWERHEESYKAVRCIAAEHSKANIQIFTRGVNKEKPVLVYPANNFTSAAEALDYYRNEDNKNTLKTFEKRINVLKKQMQNRNAPQDQCKQLNEIYNLICNRRTVMERKTVFITGAASGIGRATAALFAANGFLVGAYDINKEGLESLKTELGDNCITGVCDVTNDAAMKKAFESFAKAANGKIDVLCANAGILVQKSFEDGELTAYKRMIDINAYGMVNTIYQALPYLKAAEKPCIVITSSSSATFGMPKFSVYGSTKIFLRSLTEALSVELKKYKIKVSDVMPLFVKSGMTKDQGEERFKKASTQTPEQIAKVIYKATKSKKRHHRVGFNVKLIGVLSRILPTRWMEWFLKTYLKVK